MKREAKILAEVKRLTAELDTAKDRVNAAMLAAVEAPEGEATTAAIDELGSALRALEEVLRRVRKLVPNTEN